MLIKITNENAGLRLDSFLVEFLKKEHNLSRAQIQKLIKENKILLNNKNISPHKKLQEGDELTILSFKPKIKNTPEQKKKVALLLDWDKIIVKETDDYLLINKPAGVTVHGSANIKEQTLADELLKVYPQIKKVGDDPYRPGIVHRLDKEVSGLMVIAKNQDSFLDLKKQFQQRDVSKYYEALVYGNIEKEDGKIDFPITRSQSGYKMAALPKTVKGEENFSGRYAETHFEVMQHFINFSLLKVEIKTGRTHQIRVHLSAIDHPIVGDNIYGTRKTREKNTKYNLGRIFLVAKYLSFRNLLGKKQEFEIELPQNLKNFLSQIK